MPTFKITINLAIEGKMVGEKWHPSHDLEKVSAHFTNLAVGRLGKSRVKTVEVIMTDNDAPKTLKKKEPSNANPVKKRREIYIEKPSLKERNKK